MKIIQKPSPNFDDRDGQEPYIILLHYTGMKTARDALERLTDNQSGVSSHYTIDKEGAIYQHVDEAMRAWHAGKSCWLTETNINAVSFGIEIVNAGHEFGYKEFTDSQIKAVQKLCLDIQGHYKIKHVLGHSDVAPCRKKDPGELFPWKALASYNIGVWPNYYQGNVENINIEQALQDIGYDVENLDAAVIAFQRHFVPEVFEEHKQGQICDLTKNRLKALSANHLISVD